VAHALAALCEKRVLVPGELRQRISYYSWLVGRVCDLKSVSAKLGAVDAERNRLPR
jgi:hypothetical protein